MLSKNKPIIGVSIIVLVVAGYFVYSKVPNKNTTALISNNLNSLEFDEIRTVKSHEVNSDNQKNYEFLLGIKKYDLKAAYVLRDSKNKDWIYDVLQIDNEYYDAPTERIVKTDTGDYLVVRKLYTNGTGLLQYNEIWYAINFGLDKVLEYPSDGHNFFTAEYDGMKFRSSTAMTDNGLEVDYAFDYYTKEDSEKLIRTDSKKAYFDWNKDKQKFVLNISKSKISVSELEDILGFGVK